MNWYKIQLPRICLANLAEQINLNLFPDLLKVIRGEELTVVQKDLGSGFTYVRNREDKIGYVPTSVLYSLS